MAVNVLNTKYVDKDLVPKFFEHSMNIYQQLHFIFLEYSFLHYPLVL